MTHLRYGAVIGVGAIAAMVGVAAGQTARIVFEASSNGIDWAQEVSVLPGTEVSVQMRVRLAGNTSVIGFAGVIHQPTLSNWHADRGDQRLPFSFGPPNPPAIFYGRIPPFVGSAFSEFILASFNDPGNILRFAGGNAVTPTINLAWGVASYQLPQNLAGTNFLGGTDVLIFRYGVRLADTGQARTLTAEVRPEFVNLQRTTWYTTPTGGALQVPLSAADIVPAVIHVVPGPGGVGIFGVGVLMLRGRRRGCVRAE